MSKEGGDKRGSGGLGGIVAGESRPTRFTSQFHL